MSGRCYHEKQWNKYGKQKMSKDRFSENKILVLKFENSFNGKPKINMEKNKRPAKY